MIRLFLKEKSAGHGGTEQSRGWQPVLGYPEFLLLVF